MSALAGHKQDQQTHDMAVQSQASRGPWVPEACPFLLDGLGSCHKAAWLSSPMSLLRNPFLKQPPRAQGLKSGLAK